MGAALDVSLRDEKPPEPTKQWNIRFPLRVLTYIKAQAQAPGRTQTSVVVDALELDRVLEERLAPYKSKLRAFAVENGWDLSADLPLILAELVVQGLSCLDKKSKK